MKALSIKELTEIRDRMKNQVTVREGGNRFRVVVGMATCGIAAGARPVLASFVENVEKAACPARLSSARPGASAFASTSLSSRSSRPVRKKSPM